MRAVLRAIFAARRRARPTAAENSLLLQSFAFRFSAIAPVLDGARIERSTGVAALVFKLVRPAIGRGFLPTTHTLYEILLLRSREELLQIPFDSAQDIGLNQWKFGGFNCVWGARPCVLRKDFSDLLAFGPDLLGLSMIDIMT